MLQRPAGGGKKIRHGYFGEQIIKRFLRLSSAINSDFKAHKIGIVFQQLVRSERGQWFFELNRNENRNKVSHDICTEKRSYCINLMSFYE